MARTLNAVLALTLTLTATAAFGCRPGRSIDLAFPPHSAALDAQGALRLGSWLADLRVQFPNYSDFVIAGTANPGRPGDTELATQRAETIGKFLTLRGFQSARVHVSPPSTAYPSNNNAHADKVGIDFLPACPHYCCNLPTHKVKDLGLPMP